MNLESIKEQLEDEESFQYWNKAIGLTFEDFNVYEFIENDTEYLVLKRGKKDIGNYSIHITDNEINCFCFDFRNENVRQHTLKIVGKD